MTERRTASASSPNSSQHHTAPNGLGESDASHIATETTRRRPALANRRSLPVSTCFHHAAFIASRCEAEPREMITRVDDPELAMPVATNVIKPLLMTAVEAVKAWR